MNNPNFKTLAPILKFLIRDTIYTSAENIRFVYNLCVDNSNPDTKKAFDMFLYNQSKHNLYKH